MVNYLSASDDSSRLDAVFGALSDASRRAILARLAAGPASVGELASPLPMSLPAVSKHLKVLERAGLIARDRAGRVHRCRLDEPALHQAAEWIERTRAFWEGRLDDLARYLDSKEDD